MLVLIFLIAKIPSMFGLRFCQNTSTLPKNFQINENFTIDPLYLDGATTTSFRIANRIMSRNELTMYGGKGYYDSSLYCPPDFMIPKKEDYEGILKKLGSKAYDVLTDENGFNMKSGLHYLTTTRGKLDEFFSFYLMYLNGKKIKIEDFKASSLRNITIKCILKIPNAKIEFLGVDSDFELNSSYTFINTGKYFDGFVWRIDDKNFFSTNNVSYTFGKSGNHMVEFWGHTLTGEVQYICRHAYVKKKVVSREQKYDINKVKLITTDFEINYNGLTNFKYANAAVAPKINGEYLVAVSDKLKFIHILLFDRNDNLIKDFNTSISGFPHDIVETDYGFALYAEYSDFYRSFLHLYNKQFELVNSVKIMGNKKNVKKVIPSDSSKQIMRYREKGEPDFEMGYMAEPDNGKIVYTKGRVYIIFGHSCFSSETEYHNGDTIATFNDLLEDIEFGKSWGTSHSLLQSATYDEHFFVTAALSDPGLDVCYTSKTEYDMIWGYDGVRKRFNQRKNYWLKSLQGEMTGNTDGSTDARFGGIQYFEKYKTYCMVYAKTPNYSNDSKNNINIIYLTCWQFNNGVLSNNKTEEVKLFAKDKNVLHVRVGKLGEDKIFIVYNETSQMIGYNWRVPAGTKPKVYIYELPSLKIAQKDITIDNLYMNSNEDLKTFHDGVLIWASANKEEKLVINKIGEPRLNDSFDDIEYIITKDDLINEKKKKSSGLKIFGIVMGSLIAIIILIFGALFLYRFIRKKKSSGNLDPNTIKGSLLY